MTDQGRRYYGQVESDHSYFRLCHHCLFLNEAENDISLCGRCTKPLTADAQEEEADPSMHAEIRLTSNPGEAEQDFDQEELDEIEGHDAEEEEEEEEDDEVRTTDFRRRHPLTGLAVVW